MNNYIANKIRISIEAIYEFMITEEFFFQNLNLNKGILFFARNSLWNDNKCISLKKLIENYNKPTDIFQVFTIYYLTESWRHILFLLFIEYIPKISVNLKVNFTKVRFLKILTQRDRISKLNSVSAYILSYYNFIDQNTEIKEKITQFKQRYYR